MSSCSNNKTMKRHILIAILALAALTATAQHDEQVTVEGRYRPKVNKVNKIKLKNYDEAENKVFDISDNFSSYT